MINNKNCIIITTNVNESIVGKKRQENLKNNCLKHNFNMFVIKGKKLENWTHSNLNKESKLKQMKSAYNSYKITLNMLNKFKEFNSDYGIICQDDFYPIEDFWNELNLTVSLLPKNWEILHLCPFWAWGKEFKDYKKIGQYNPMRYVKDNLLECHSSNRYFKNCNKNVYFKNNLWLGGPLAFLIKKESINKLIERYKPNKDNYLLSDDVMMTYLLDENTFICKNPQLGYEEECGGSIYHSD